MSTLLNSQYSIGVLKKGSIAILWVWVWDAAFNPLVKMILFGFPHNHKKKSWSISPPLTKETLAALIHTGCARRVYMSLCCVTVYPWTFKLESDVFWETISHWKLEVFLLCQAAKKSCHKTCLISFAPVHVLHAHIVMLMFKIYTVQLYMVHTRGRPDILHFYNYQCQWFSCLIAD